MFNMDEDQLTGHMNTVKNQVLRALREAKYLSGEEQKDLRDRLVVALTKEKWFSNEEEAQKNNNYQIDVMFRKQFPTNITTTTEGDGEETND